jgi:hypothetical protein
MPVYFLKAEQGLIALKMEAARTSETSVDIQLRTRQYIPEDSEDIVYILITAGMQFRNEKNFRCGIPARFENWKYAHNYTYNYFIYFTYCDRDKTLRRQDRGRA